ncbi:hypothetical protein RSSM_04855 [Rhodopirellula sallentina SM41]|uniref:Uncharacterized protein n=1 Tax=Rhodopirellula sallentina SM41 TaxID=1263870 RepID=M5TXH9_9BACT|nr:hypothetical protein RSSM_04855 [Rhodopirellula sallentina SM41]
MEILLPQRLQRHPRPLPENQAASEYSSILNLHVSDPRRWIHRNSALQGLAIQAASLWKRVGGARVPVWLSLR